jgi:hypothetical protein
MRETCEKCSGALGLDAEGFVCRYECTFCPACATGMSGTCPNCAGELVPRPRRTSPTLTPRAVVRRLQEIWNTADVGAVDEVYAEDFVGHFPPSSRLPERCGRAGAREGSIILPEISIYRVVLDDLGRPQQLGAMPGHS